MSPGPRLLSAGRRSRSPICRRTQSAVLPPRRPRSQNRRRRYSRSLQRHAACRACVGFANNVRVSLRQRIARQPHAATDIDIAGEFTNRIKEDLEAWSKLIRAANLQPG